MTSSTPGLLPEGSKPRHVAIIMDGNNRWAKARGQSGIRGHHAGVEAVRAVIRRAAEQEIETLTLFAFSSENWRRPRTEVEALMQLFQLALQREVKKLHRYGIRLSVVGDREGLPAVVRKHIDKAEALTADNTRLHLVIAANYGGQWDIARAARRLAERVDRGEISPLDIDENSLGQAMCLATDAPVDLCIRTSGEQRISNFMLWQMAYAELYFTSVLWPDFGADAFDAALLDFAGRKRRFGRTDDQVEDAGA
ncbi:MAG: polyprenyl diphosphate synthase [Halomonas sp.]|uniref:polyprenyl diphosphate synthase n=1 Tax=Halomonas sp. TaxID=1486246 RepID=UPI003F912D4D